VGGTNPESVGAQLARTVHRRFTTPQGSTAKTQSGAGKTQ
jgi:hypothetical protein